MQSTKAYCLLVTFCCLSAFAVLPFSNALEQDAEIKSNSEADFVTTELPEIEIIDQETLAAFLNSTTDGPRSSELAEANKGSETAIEHRSIFGGSEGRNSIQSTASTVNKPVKSQCRADSTFLTFACIIEDTELETWEAPLDIQKEFPYYLAGSDYDGRPLWISEFGKYNIRKVIEGDQNYLDNMDKYIKQGAYRILKSLNTTDEGVSEIFYIVDFEGLSLYQFANSKSIRFILRMLTLYREVIIEHFAGAFMINTNYVAERVVAVFRLALGRALEKIEIYGTQASKWKPVLRRTLPLESIPTWYGGNKDYKPIKVYG